jgi:hypothetical protein
MKSIKKIVAASTLSVTLLGFGFDPKPVEARGLVCLLLGCKKAVVKDTDLLYGAPPDYDSLYGKEPPEPQDYNPNGPSPYGWYGNQLENVMGRDIREIIELDKRRYKRTFESDIADDKTLRRSAYILPFGEMEKSVLLKNGNTAYIFEYSASTGSPGTPDRQEPRIISVPFDNYTYGAQTIYDTIPGTPATPGRYIQCTTHIVADQYGKLFYWSYRGSSKSINNCSSDERRPR